MRYSFLKSSGSWWQAPPRCVLCHDLAADLYLCPTCARLIAALGIQQNVCPLCAKPSVNNAICGHCQQSKWHFDRLWASHRLDWPLHELVLEYKFQRQWSYAAMFADWMRVCPPPWLVNQAFDGVVPMPLSRVRLLHRGYNQAQLLAEALQPHLRCSQAAFLPVQIQRQHAPAQSTLNHAQRLKNARGIFRLQSDVNKRNLLLIDDVVTTSATLNELARILKLAGAHSVSCWVLARS